MATFIYSTKGRSRESILTYTQQVVYIDRAVNKFIDKLFSENRARLAANRLHLKDGRYMYTPSNEYNKLAAKFIRFKPMA
jgi:phosphoglycerol transferase MdoB-like AlkP superfamily enzyme